MFMHIFVLIRITNPFEPRTGAIRPARPFFPPSRARARARARAVASARLTFLLSRSHFRSRAQSGARARSILSHGRAVAAARLLVHTAGNKIQTAGGDGSRRNSRRASFLFASEFLSSRFVHKLKETF